MKSTKVVHRSTAGIPCLIASGCFALLAITLLMSRLNAEVRLADRPHQTQDASSELREDLVQLDEFLSNRNLDFLETTVNKVSAKWAGRDKASFYTYMYKACSLLSSYDIGDLSKRALLLSRYSISALTSGDLPLSDRVRFTEFLMFDPPTINETHWKELREQKARLWLEARRAIAINLDPTFDVNDRPLLNVQTPRGSGVPSGAAPESIKDPALRAEYQIAIAQNSAKARRYNDQYWLKTNAQRFYEETERYLVNAYSRPPADLAQLEHLLTEYDNDSAFRGRILEQLRKRAD